MIKTKVAILEGRLLTSQSEQFKKYSKSSDWLEKSRPSQKPLLFWSCKQAKYHLPKGKLGLVALDDETMDCLQRTALSIWWYKIGPSEDEVITWLATTLKQFSSVAKCSAFLWYDVSTLTLRAIEAKWPPVAWFSSSFWYKSSNCIQVSSWTMCCSWNNIAAWLLLRKYWKLLRLERVFNPNWKNSMIIQSACSKVKMRTFYTLPFQNLKGY